MSNYTLDDRQELIRALREYGYPSGTPLSQAYAAWRADNPTHNWAQRNLTTSQISSWFLVGQHPDETDEEFRARQYPSGNGGGGSGSTRGGPGTTGDASTGGGPFANTGNIGTTNPSIVCQVFAMAVAYVDQVNAYKQSANNAQKPTSTLTFKDSAVIVTGGFSGVTSNPKLFSEDLAKVGKAINLANINTHGHPLQLLSDFAQAAGGISTNLLAQLKTAGVTSAQLSQIESGQWQSLPADVATRAYNAMSTVTGLELAQVMASLKTTTAGITVMTDLLDPARLFPTAWSTMLTPDGKESKAIGSVAVTESIPGYSVTASAAASNNIQLRNSLRQLKSLSNATTEEIGREAVRIVLPADLNTINELTGPVPVEDTAFSAAEFSLGTGPDGLYTVRDVIFGGAFGAMFADMDTKFEDLPKKAKPPVISFAQSLHDYGADSSTGGKAQTITEMLNLNSRAGQSILAALIEGNNIKAIRNAGLSHSPEIPKGASGTGEVSSNTPPVTVDDGPTDADTGSGDPSVPPTPAANTVQIAALTLAKNSLDFYTMYNYLPGANTLEFEINTSRFWVDDADHIVVALGAEYQNPHPIHPCGIRRADEMLFATARGVIIQRARDTPGVIEEIWNGTTSPVLTPIPNTAEIASSEVIGVVIEYRPSGSNTEAVLTLKSAAGVVLLSKSWQWPSTATEVKTVVGVIGRAFAGCSKESTSNTSSSALLITKNLATDWTTTTVQVPSFSATHPVLVPASQLQPHPSTVSATIMSNSWGFSGRSFFDIKDLTRVAYDVNILSSFSADESAYTQWRLVWSDTGSSLIPTEVNPHRQIVPAWGWDSTEVGSSPAEILNNWHSQINANTSVHVSIHDLLDCMPSDTQIESLRVRKTAVTFYFRADGVTSKTLRIWVWRRSWDKSVWMASTVNPELRPLDSLTKMGVAKVYSGNAQTFAVYLAKTWGLAGTTRWNSTVDSTLPTRPNGLISSAQSLPVETWATTTVVDFETAEPSASVRARWYAISVSSTQVYSFRLTKDFAGQIYSAAKRNILLVNSAGSVIENKIAVATNYTDQVEVAELTRSLPAGQYYLGVIITGTLYSTYDPALDRFVDRMTLEARRGSALLGAYQQFAPNLFRGKTATCPELGYTAETARSPTYNVTGRTAGRQQMVADFYFRSNDYFKLNPNGHFAVVAAQHGDLTTQATGKGLVLGNVSGLPTGSHVKPTVQVESFFGLQNPGNQVVADTGGWLLADRNPYRINLRVVDKAPGQGRIEYRLYTGTDNLLTMTKSTVDTWNASPGGTGLVFGHVFQDTANGWSFEFYDIAARWEGQHDITKTTYGVVFAHFSDEYAFFEPLLWKADLLIQAGPPPAADQVSAAVVLARDANRVTTLHTAITTADYTAAALLPCPRDTEWADSAKEALRVKLKATGLTTFVTHSPWGELGDPVARKLSEIMTQLADEEGWTLWAPALSKTGGFAPVSSASQYQLVNIALAEYSIGYISSGPAVSIAAATYSSLWRYRTSTPHTGGIEYYRVVNAGTVEIGPGDPTVASTVAAVGSTYTC